MRIECIPGEFAICKVVSWDDIDLDGGFLFVGKTDAELSVVCDAEHVPQRTTACDAGWRAFRFAGQLDFSLTGILARASAVLADAKVGIFAVSTYDTDYILVKAGNWERALAALAQAGYTIVRDGEPSR